MIKSYGKRFLEQAEKEMSRLDSIENKLDTIIAMMSGKDIKDKKPLLRLIKGED